MNKSKYWLALIVLGCLGLCLMWVHTGVSHTRNKNLLANEYQLVKRLGLTDICLFTEARYTRHLSQADRHAAFQDNPCSMDHFPTGSIALPLTLENTALYCDLYGICILDSPKQPDTPDKRTDKKEE